MHKYLLTVFTAFLVSIDSFVAGFSLSLNKRNNNLPTAVAFATLVLCIATSVFGKVIGKHLDVQTVNVIGGVLLATIGSCNLFAQETEQTNLVEQNFWQNLAIGFAVGLDASIANLSLSLQTFDIVAPVTFSLFHYVSVWLGQKFADKLTLKHSNVICATILWLLAVTKWI